MSDESSETLVTRAHGRSGLSAGDTARLVLALVLVAILVVFAVSNRQQTTVDLVVKKVDAPLVLVLLVTAVIGALAAALVRFQWHHHR